ncbi:MAG: hypothetical protein VYE26_00755 [Pseudomonadota bacterium]|nr:hypothetical protein [Pseudomonadota bacterium]
MTELKEFRVVASRVTNYVAYVEAYDQIEAESISRSSGLDWQFIDDDDYEVHTIEEVE